MEGLSDVVAAVSGGAPPWSKAAAVIILALGVVAVMLAALARFMKGPSVDDITSAVRAGIKEAINGDIKDLREDIQALAKEQRENRRENDARHVDNVQRLARVEVALRLHEARGGG